MSPSLSKPSDQICLGMITGCCGLKGELRLKSFTEDPKDILSYGDLTDASGEQVFSLSFIRATKSDMIVQIPGVQDRTGAEALKGVKLYVSRDRLSELQEEEYFHADLVGLEVHSADGLVLGAIQAVHNYGAGDFLEFQKEGETFTVPFTKEAVPTVLLKDGHVIVDPTMILSTKSGENHVES
ncbi:MAG: 16S rRNA processing protein RimM [Alphaproteobacteria bacterium]|jgi:16S rRNA processing protein RimM|nr:16S rRNA processing protein RimM [Alphaproteobacteria bacterium]MBT5389967.1 16S rRNA processing protein RimM [Alphaproteobacteria bacterium]MBT5541062.1 16S rRNA processing protein RimM [Alphaproteobacteria bacterium]MBT5654052.1 16S rRNA processing protein RimM [Alphaproteobacteria bacterium]